VKPASKVDEYFESDFEIQDNYSKILADPQEEEVGFEVNSTINVAGSASQQVDDLDEEDAETDQSSDEDMKHYGLDEPYDPKLDLSDYQLPSVDMLVNYEAKNVEVTKEELVANKNKIVETLKNYSIDIVKIVASPGPTVTLYEIVPAPGIRISKIKNLEDDIALSLAALGIRIIAPIPGKGTIGIEVPNANPQIVSMRTMLTSDKFLNNKFELPIAIGKTISNEPYVADLCKMPHLLMAGATGQGKSVGLNAIIASLLYKKHPAELKFIMVDPKKVELSLYNKIERHYLAKLPDSEEAIITDTRKVVRTLNSLCIEMDARYDLLKQAQVKNIKEYNPKFMSRRLNPEKGHRYLPYIVVVVDEFADLIMTAGKEVEHPIARIAQLARAVGIHLIIATQRPSVNIITGTIKANFPARIAFRVTSKIDSRTILDTGGADQLIGRGDMLLSSGSEIVRLQCALIDTEEIEKVAEFIGSQRGYPDCFLLPEYLDEESEPNKEFDPKQKDEYFEEAARLVVTSQHGSTSLLQRKLQLGYNRAGRIIDQLEAAGIVGPFEGSKAREVLIKTEAELKEHLKNMTH
jgi:S-DNA-T family DNA segregation ATPase FtsK/SpoIIIE